MTSRAGVDAPLLPEPATGNYFVSAYPPFSCWSPDTLADYRRALQKPSQEGGDARLGLYVHLPFCVERCPYCYYRAYDGKLGEMPDYLAALGREFSIYMDTPVLAGRPLAFVYFGGGTPSLLTAPQIHRLFGELRASAAWDAVEEVTFECAPRSVTDAKLKALREAGVTRLSMGVQQLDDEVLAANGRVHSVGDVLRAFERIQRVGFDVVNLDLITGLVGESDETFMNSLDRILELAPDSVTVYQLEIPHNTPLYRTIREGALGSEPADWHTKRVRLAGAFAALEEAGYSVTTAYCAVRDPEKDRFVYQDAQYRGADLLGIGVSSFSFLNGFHQQNRTRLDTYMDEVSSGRLPLGRAYALAPLERLVREFVLQLKLGHVDLAELTSRHAVDPPDFFEETLQRFVAAGWIECESDRVSLTRAGLLRADRMIPEFYLDEHRVDRYS